MQGNKVTRRRGKRAGGRQEGAVLQQLARQTCFTVRGNACWLLCWIFLIRRVKPRMFLVFFWAMKMHARNLYESPNKISEAIVCHHVARATHQRSVDLLTFQLPHTEISSIHFSEKKKHKIYDDICFSRKLASRWRSLGFNGWERIMYSPVVFIIRSCWLRLCYLPGVIYCQFEIQQMGKCCRKYMIYEPNHEWEIYDLHAVFVLYPTHRIHDTMNKVFSALFKILLKYHDPTVPGGHSFLSNHKCDVCGLATTACSKYTHFEIEWNIFTHFHSSY